MGRISRIPRGRKVFGANINIKPALFLGTDWWSNQLLEWDWNGWIKPQVDFVKGNNLGCNAIRMQASIAGVVMGVYSQKTHDDRVYQLAEYCAQSGVYYYHCVDSFQPLCTTAFATRKVADIADATAITLDRLAKLPNVFAVDLFNEVIFDSIGAGKIQEYIVEVRKRHRELPLTVSSASATTAAGGAPDLETRGLSPYLDFFDFHLYYGPQVRPVTRNTFAFYENNYPDADIIFGETGVHEATPVALQNTDLTEFFEVANTQSPRYRGALIWAPADNRAAGDGGNPATIAEDQWGFYTGGNGVAPSQPRTNRIDVMRRYTFGSVARNNATLR